MSSEALSWALQQETGYPSCKLVLIQLAEGAGGSSDNGWFWSGSLAALASACEMDEMSLSWSLWTLREMRAVREAGLVGDEGIYEVLVGGGIDIGRLWEPVGHRPTRPVYRGAKISKGKRQRIYARDGHQCVLCAATDDLTLDHIHPRSLGGTNAESNLRTLCRPCNSSKGARI